MKLDQQIPSPSTQPLCRSVVCERATFIIQYIIYKNWSKAQGGSTTQHIRVRLDLFIFETEFLHFWLAGRT